MNPQDDPQWRLDRCGSVGASEVADIMRRNKNGYSAARANLMAQKVVERLTGVPFEGFTSAAMLKGREREPDARLAYELLTNSTVDLVGIVKHPLIAGTHASPDGVIGDLGLLEIKSPQPAAHLETLLTETIDPDYLKQMQHQMGCSGRHWVDYCSYNPDFPAEMQVFIKRVHRDGAIINEIESELRQFLKELDEKMAVLQARYSARAA